MQKQDINRTDRLALTIADAVIRHPWRTIMVALLLLAATGSGGRFIEFANNYRVFFSPENPELVAFEEFQATYTKNDNILFTLKPTHDAVFSPSVADAIEKLTAEAWMIPYASRVDSVTNFQHSWADGDLLVVEDLIRDGITLTQAELEEKRAIAIAEPLLYGNLVAEDVGATGINVTLQYPEQSLTEVPEAVAVARGLAAEIEREFPDITVAISGVSMLDNAFAEAGIADAGTLMPAMYLILLITMVLVLRSASGTFAALLVIMFSTVTAIGIAGYAGIKLNPISVTAPIVIMTLAVADSVHILVSMLALMRTGRDKLSALRESMRINFLAVSLTSMTTIIGFLSLNFSDAPPFRDLGNITAMGIGAAWLFSITLLPAVIALLPFKVVVRNNDRQESATAMERFAGFVTTRYRPVLLGTVIVAVGFIAMIPTIELDDQWVEYFDHRVEFRTDTDFMVENLTGIYNVEYSVEAKEAEGINDPVYLRNLEHFTAWLREQPEVRHVYSYADVVKRLNKNMHGDDPEWYRIPENRQLAAQYLLLYELSLPFGLDLNDRISVDKSSTRVTATLETLSTREVRAFLTYSQDWLRQHTPEYMWAKPTSATVMFSFISERNIQGMFTGNVLAITLIALLMIVSLRTLSLGMLSLIPNAVPILMTFGAWGLFVGEVGMAAATVSATSLGIIVDNTVHFLTKYLRARRETGADRPQAITYAFNTVGTAILINAVILAVGFGVLAFSTFKVNVELGLLTALAIVIALIIDFLLLPALLMIGHKQKGDVRHEHILVTQPA